ncbi:MAG TPA: polysaccharide biosynthesis protein [Bacteroidales bacterium]|nr:polysaccharide biosynthesis protein [Bacteroidales bacterium]
MGIFIGFLTSGLLFPLFLKTDEIGLLNILVAYSSIFAQFGSLGFNAAATRLFTYFRNEKNNHNGFLFLSMMVGIAGFLLAVIVLILLKHFLLTTGGNESLYFESYFWYLIPLIFFTLFFNALDTYYKMLYNSVIGTFMKEFVQRILILLVFAFYFLKWIDFSQYVLGYVVAMALPTLLVTVVLIKEKSFNLKPNLSFINTELRKSLTSVSFFGIISGFSSLIILQLGTIMITMLLGLSSTGVYTTMFFYATLILIPSRAIIKISSVVIADKWKNNDVAAIADIYYKSCINQLVIAAILFIGLWGNIDNIFRILPAEFESGKYILLFIGLANLFDMATGVNGTIISTSKYYKIHTYIMIFLIALIIVTNLIFIPIYGIVGAAFGSAISVFVFNIVRYLFLLSKYKMQPFNYKHLLIIGISAFSYLSVYFIPEIENLLFDILIRSSIMTIVFVIPVYFLKISDEINQGIKSIWSKIKIKQ